MMDPDGLELEEALFGDRRGKEEEEDDEDDAGEKKTTKPGK